MHLSSKHLWLGPPLTLRSRPTLSGKSVSRAAAIARNLKEIGAESCAAVLKTGLTPSASGSAYLEFEQPQPCQASFWGSPTPKIVCTVHGPRPLPSSAPFSSSLVLSAYVKFATFASERRRGYLRDSLERDLAVHLEGALRAVVIAERWPKSCIEVVVTILETDMALSARTASNDSPIEESVASMLLLSGCINAASAALLHAGIDCIDVLTGGAAVLLARPLNMVDQVSSEEYSLEVVLDPYSYHSDDIAFTCVIGYLGAQDEIANMWIRTGSRSLRHPAATNDKTMEQLIQGAVEAAAATRAIVIRAAQTLS